MPHDDKQIWLDALAGRIKHPQSDVGREIELIRNYYRRTDELAEPVHSTAQQQRQARMLQWLKERGAFAQPQTPVVSNARKFAANRAWYAAMAAVCIAVFTVALMGKLPGQAEPDAYTMRGAAAIQNGIVAQPQAAATQLQQALAQFGVPVRRVEEPGGSRVETRIPEQDIAAARKLLAPWQIAVPDNGIVIVRFAARP